MERTVPCVFCDSWVVDCCTLGIRHHERTRIREMLGDVARRYYIRGNILESDAVTECIAELDNLVTVSR